MAKKAAEKQIKPLVREVLESRQQNPSHVTDIELGIDPEELISQRAQVTADQIAIVRQKLANSADGHLSAASDIVIRTGINRRMSDTEFTAFRRSVDRAAREVELDRELRDLEAGFRDQIKVSGEVNPYADEGSPHSWVADILTESTPDAFAGRQADSQNDLDRRDRLQRHAAIVARSLERNNSYGKKIRAQLGEQYRQHNIENNKRVIEKNVPGEIRALTTGGGATASASGGGAAAFIVPDFLLSVFERALYRSPYGSFVNAIDNSLALAPWGMETYVPTFTTGTTVATVVEGDAIAEGDPVSNYTSCPIVDKAGQISVAQAALDRIGPVLRGDAVLFAQLANQLAAAKDLYAITQVISGAQTVTNSGSFALTGTSGMAGFYGDIKKAKSLLSDTLGVRLKGDAIFAASDFVDYIESWADAQGRPVFSPSFEHNHQGVQTPGDPKGEGFTGHVLSGLALHEDDNIPTATTAELLQLIVCRCDTNLQLDAPPVPYVYPAGGLAGNLEATLGIRQYVATVPLYPTGVSVITGAAYAASTFNAE